MRERGGVNDYYREFTVKGSKGNKVASGLSKVMALKYQEGSNANRE